MFATHTLHGAVCVTCDNVRVYVERIIDWIDMPLLVVLLAEGEGAVVHSDVVDVGVVPHCVIR